MLARSFRFRIALLSTLLSGVVLLAFGLAFLAVIRQVALERVDREIKSLGESQLRMSRPGGQIGRQLQDSLRFVHGEEGERLFVYEIERDGAVVFRSPGWPAELSALPRPSLLLPPPEDRPGRRPPPRRRGGLGGLFGDPGPPGARPDPPPPRPEEDAEGQDRRRAGPPGDGPPWDGPPGEGLPGDGPSGGGPPGPFGAGERLPPLAPPVWDPLGGGDRPPRLYEPEFRTVFAAGKKWRCGVIGHERGAFVRIGVDMARFEEDNDQYRAALWIAYPLALALLAGAGFWLARRALRPIERITATAARINARGLHERIPEIRSDEEFDQLVQVMNGMLERLERSFHQASRFAADAAHELKTPLTILQGQLEQAVQDAADGSEAQQVSSELLGEVQRLRSIVRKLLLLAQADAGHLLRGQETVDWSALVAQVAEDTREAAPALEVRVDLEPGIGVRGDGDLLTQLLHNLSSNAVKFNQPQAPGKPGVIEIRLESQGGVSKLTFANTAAPLPPAELARIFERFFRGDPSRNRRVEGVGLGLALCREIAAGHGGDLKASQRPGWIRFELELPQVPAPAAGA